MNQKSIVGYYYIKKVSSKVAKDPLSFLSLLGSFMCSSLKLIWILYLKNDTICFSPYFAKPMQLFKITNWSLLSSTMNLTLLIFFWKEVQEKLIQKKERNIWKERNKAIYYLFTWHDPADKNFQEEI